MLLLLDRCVPSPPGRTVSIPGTSWGPAAGVLAALVICPVQLLSCSQHRAGPDPV